MNSHISASVERQKFDSEIKVLLKTPHLLFPFIRYNLRRFHIIGCEVSDIFLEAYIRGVNRIESGQSIDKTQAWMRTTSFNVIREISRKQKRSQPVDQDFLESQIALAQAKAGISMDNEFNDDSEAVMLLLQHLKSQDQEILYLRLVQGLSWQAVSERLALNRGSHLSESTLRKRGQRALEYLRQIHQSM